MSILTHSPAIVRDGLVLCLDAGAVRSYPGTGPELVSNGNFESSFTNYWTIRAGQTEGNQVLTQDSSIVKSGTYSAKIVVGGSSPNYDGMKSDSSGNFTLTNGKRYLFSFDVYPVNDTGIDAYIVAGSTYCGTNVTGLTQGAWNNVELFIDVTATSSSSFVEFQTGSAWGDGTWYFDNVSVREVLWNDLSGNFNNAGNVNAPTFSALSGSGGTKYFDFDGTNDYMTISSPSFAANGFTSGLTCEAWLRFDTASLSGSDTGFITRYQAGQQSQFLFGYREAGGQNGLSFYMIADDNSVPGAPFDTDWTPAIDRWYHIVAVYSPSTKMEIFVDGVSIFTMSSSVPSQLNDDSTLDVMIGNFAGGTYFNGKIAILRMYNRALTIGEAQQNYRTHKGRFGL
jgi:hypothetical protein